MLVTRNTMWVPIKHFYGMDAVSILLERATTGLLTEGRRKPSCVSSDVWEEILHLSSRVTIIYCMKWPF